LLLFEQPAAGIARCPPFLKQKRLRKSRAGAELGLAELEAQAQDEVGSLRRVSQDARPFFKQKRLRKGRAGAELGLAELEAQAQDEVGGLWRISQDIRPFLRAASPKSVALSVTLAFRFFNA